MLPKNFGYGNRDIEPKLWSNLSKFVKILFLFRGIKLFWLVCNGFTLIKMFNDPLLKKVHFELVSIYRLGLNKTTCKSSTAPLKKRNKKYISQDKKVKTICKSITGSCYIYVCYTLTCSHYVFMSPYMQHICTYIH